MSPQSYVSACAESLVPEQMVNEWLSEFQDGQHMENRGTGKQLDMAVACGAHLPSPTYSRCNDAPCISAGRAARGSAYGPAERERWSGRKFSAVRRPSGPYPL